MKKSHKIFLSILFCLLVAMPFATGFLWQENAIETSIKSVEVATPKIENDTELIEDIKEEVIETTWTEPTYKTYDDYFTDYDFSNLTLTGNGTKDSPFQVNSTEDFLWLVNGNNFADSNEKRGVPNIYQEVSYLQSTGTQYIDTGVVIKNSIRPYIKYKVSSVYNSSGSCYNIFGGTDSSVPIAIGCNYGDGNVAKIYAWHGESYGNGNKINSFNAPHDTIHELQYTDRWVFNDTASSVMQIDAGNNSTEVTIAFFGRNTNGTFYPFNIREYLNIYAFKLYDGDELIRDYVPCYRKSDNKPGMYDLVTGVFYTNQGEGEFLYEDFYGQNGTLKVFSNCYIKLNRDIYLNDENFDLEGNPSGGDGVIYKWNKSINMGHSIRFDGGEHIISGLYSNKNLFGSSRFSLFENLNIENSYAELGAQSALLTYEASTIRNCKVGEGTVVSSSDQISVFARTASVIENCTNYANVKGKNYIGGFAFQINKLAKNCVNYGDVYASENWCGGLTPFNQKSNISFIDCVNYGKIDGNCYVGGIMGGALYDWIQVFQSCKNFGIVTSRITASARTAGGLIGTVSKKATIDNCVAGNIVSAGYKCGLFVGTGTAVITNCKVDVDMSHKTITPTCSLVGVGGNSKFSNCSINITNYKYVDLGSYGGSELIACELGKEAEVSNIDIKLLSTNQERSVYLTKSASQTTRFKNINITTNFKIKSKTLLKLGANSLFENIIITGNESYIYYGSDFSDFYIDWKTAQIGLKTRSSKGFYQGEVTEELLLQKGFEKKSV